MWICYVTPRKRRVSRNFIKEVPDISEKVTPRKRRVSRNYFQVDTHNCHAEVTPRKRRVSRNIQKTLNI